MGKGAMSNRSSAAVPERSETGSSPGVQERSSSTMPECAQTSSEAGVQKCSPTAMPQRSPPAVPASAKAAVLRCPACVWKISQSTAFTIYYYLFITFYPYHLMALKKTYKALLKYISV